MSGFEPLTCALRTCATVPIAAFYRKYNNNQTSTKRSSATALWL